ncbi:hypothetical protein [Nocardioides sp. CFH 31398]|uniref:hypothetical protein n=1 Tax=Nocardioides sp. CFH 31398 TaxID=2919579 RepID=UPI001F06E19E|nr:hypothetical protein [Nocardioides sp. CFH 31398]MCH1867077.1 hypothetical protein [Nocardioides sp. CFH 31398]
MSAPDRRPRFRAAVYAEREGMTNGCRVLLLRLADSMNARGIVSVPRAQLADEFGVHTSGITERIKLARDLGFLDIVRRGRPGVTAVYQGLIPASMVRQSAPPSMVRKPGGDMVRQSAPSESATWCATDPTQEGDGKRESPRPRSVGHRDEKRSNEKIASTKAAVDVTDCEWHPWQRCPEDCRNAERRAS